MNKEKKTLEDSYRVIMEKNHFDSTQLYQDSRREGFESILHPDYSEYSTSSVSSSIL